MIKLPSFPTVFLFFATLFVSIPGLSSEISGPATIIDGDTIKIWELSIRLEGIDAPEIGQTCIRPGGGQYSCGEDSADRLKSLLIGKEVRCRGDEKDRYDRLIATCFLGDQNLNRQLVLEGWAVAFVQYSDTYVAEEQIARTNRAGIWDGDFTRPSEFRAQRFEEKKGSSQTATVAGTNCTIKGNINSKGVKIYHTPWGSKHYKRTKIDTSKGERWFCSEDEAIAAGWRAPIR